MTVPANSTLRSFEIDAERSSAEVAVINRVGARFRCLESLDRGWLDGEGERISRTSIDVAKSLVRGRPLWFADAGIFPTPDGGVQIETRKSGRNVEIEFSPEGQFSGSVAWNDGEFRFAECGDLDELMAIVDVAKRGEGRDDGRE